MDNDITKEQLVKELDSSFLKLAVEDMKRALDANANLAVFILGACFIEALAGFYFGQEYKDDRKNYPKSGERFKGFVKKYLKQYNLNDLWRSLRCGLVHSYVVDGNYAFTNKKKNQHLKPTPNRKLKIVNDENFYDDLNNAYEKFKKDILADPKIFEKAKKRYNSLKIMKIDLIRKS